MKTPDITVAIPTYRRGHVLIDTIKDVLGQSYKNLELVVVDQSESHDPETKRALASIKDKRFRYFVVDPPSLPAARNFALKVAKSPYVLYLDDDVELHKDMVKWHLEAFKKDPKISAVGGRVMQEGFPIKKSVLVFDEYAISNGVFTATEAAYTNAFPGGNHTVRVKDALAVGGYDTRYYWNAFREESDMAMKMVRKGMKIYYEPKAELLHLAAPVGGTRAKTYTALYDSPLFYRNEIFFTIRNAEKKLMGLKKKYHEYCGLPEGKRSYKRSWLFLLGIIAAIWRLMFARQIVSVERPS